VISFTGSTRTGRAIGVVGAARMKRFGLELGGKSPMILFNDADADAALPVLEKARPMIDKANVTRVAQVVEAAIAAGAKTIVRGGTFHGGAARQRRLLPAVLEVSDPKLDTVQQETFGPVLTLQVFEDEAEAVALANDSEYGLAASVWTRDVNRSLWIAQALDAGSVWINDWAKVYDSTEGGGFKQSGLGRMNGLAALDDFIELKHIALKPGLLAR
jgi:betaine-aldehyde dehydrogenase